MPVAYPASLSASASVTSSSGSCLADLRTEQLLRGPVGTAREPVGQVEPGRVLAGHQGRPGGRADRARGIRLGEPLPPGGQLVEVRGPVELAPVTPEVRPARSSADDQDDVRLILGPATSEAQVREHEPPQNRKPSICHRVFPRNRSRRASASRWIATTPIDPRVILTDALPQFRARGCLGGPARPLASDEDAPPPLMLHQDVSSTVTDFS